MTSPAPAQETLPWDTFFRVLRRELNAFAIRRWPLPKDRSGPEQILGRRRLFDLFPVAVNIIIFDTEGVDVRFSEHRFATAIRYDLSKPKTLTIKDHGIIPLREFDSHAAEIQSALGVGPEILPDLRKLTFSSITDYPDLLHIVLYDVRTNIPKCSRSS